MLDMPNPGKDTANAQAIGGACRQTGRSIEDCYALHPEVDKADIFSGWKTMSEYMNEHNLKEVPSVLSRVQKPAPQPSNESPQSAEVPVPQVAAH